LFLYISNMKNILSVLILFNLTFIIAQSKIENNDYDYIVENIRQFANNDDYDSIIKEIDKLSENDSAYYDLLITKSYYLMQQKKYEEAIKITNKGLKEARYTPKYSFYINKGVSLRSLKKYDDALKLYNEALKIYPKNHIFNYNKGLIFEAQGAYNKAIESYQKTIALNPFYANSHLKLGNLFYRKRLISQALMCFNVYLILNPEGEAAFNVLNSLNKAVSASNQSDEIKGGLISSEDNESFEDLDLLIDNRIALNEEYKTSNEINIAFTKQNHLLLNQLVEISGNGGFWAKRYLPLYKWIMTNDLFDAFIYTTTYSIKNEKYKKIVEKKVPEIKSFISSFKEVLGKTMSEWEYAVDGVKKTLTHYFDEEKFYGIGIMKSENFIGKWEFYNKHGRLITTGNFDENGERKGNWVWLDSFGKKEEEGTYLAGKVTDIYKEYFSNGKLQYSTTYSNGIVNGEFKAYNIKGALIEKKNFKEGKLDGAYQSFYEVGESSPSSKVIYENGEAVGKAQQFYPNGTLKFEVNFVNGLREGIEKNYFDDGKLLNEIPYINGDYNGLYKQYHHNGVIEEEGQAKDGANVGEWKEYYTNGILSRKYNYNKGMLNGLYHDNNYQGKPYSDFVYRNGEIIEYTYFDKEGSIIKTARKKGGEFLYEGYSIDGNKISEGLYNIKGGKKGAWKFYTNNGVLSGEGNYEDDKILGVYTNYHTNGKISNRVGYKNDSVTGYYENYYKWGQLEQQGWYRDNASSGIWKSYYPDGTLKEEDYYHKGKLHGNQKSFTAKGKLYLVSLYQYGELIRESYYDDKGVFLEEISFLDQGITARTTLKHSNGKPYINVDYKNGVKQGKYEEFDFYGTKIIDGHYLNGKPHGDWKWYYPNGALRITGSVINDKYHGEWTKYYKDGQLQDKYSYVLGALNGVWESYYKDGTIEDTIEYTNNLIHGKRAFYSPEGKLQIIRYYEYGRLIGYSYNTKEGKILPMIPVKNETVKIITYYDNGKKAREMEMKNGEWVGTYKAYYYSGTLHKEHTYVDNNTHGGAIIYYPNGGVKEKKPYFHDNLHGVYELYHSNGKLKETITYVNDNREGVSKYYNEAGKLYKEEFYENDNITTVKTF